MELELGDIVINVVLKDIKNVHLSVYPPNGRVRISAPKRMSMDTIRVFALSKLDWIKSQQSKLQEQERETPREFVDGESHYLWGKRYLLRVVEAEKPPRVELEPGHMILQVRPETALQKRQNVMEAWYRQKIRKAVPALLGKWQPLIGVRVQRVYVRRMKTKWGSCNQKAGTIRLNTELAKKPRECLEYIMVHEMVHLLEPTHNERFVALMDDFMSTWRSRRDELNRRPLAHQDWEY